MPPIRIPLPPFAFMQTKHVRDLIAVFFLALLALGRSEAQVSDVEAASAVIERFAREQTRQQPNPVSIRVGKFTLQQLPPCQDFQAFAPPGTRFSGQTHLGLRCLTPKTWNILVPVQIAVTGNYLTAARSLAAGNVVQPSDLATVTGDLGTLPAGVLNSPEQAIGKSLKNPIAIGQPIRSDQLSTPWVIRQGQNVRIVSRGEGFSISSEGSALANAAPGDTTRARMSNGQIISGTVLPDGSIEIRF